MQIKRSGFLVVWVGIGLAIGCSSGSSEGYSAPGSDNQDESYGVEVPTVPTPDALAGFGGVRTCEMTGAECEDELADAMDACWWEAIDFPEYNCTGDVGDRYPYACARGREDECAIYSYQFGGGEALREVQESCLRAVERDQGCGEESVNPDCEHVARVEVPEAAAAYQCVADAACGASLDHCWPQRSAALALEICSRVEVTCEVHECSTDWITVMTSADGWLRPEAKRAVRACLDEGSCRNIDSCLTQWTHMVFAGTVDDVAPLERDAYY